MSNPQFVTISGVKTPLMTGGQPSKQCCCEPPACCLYPNPTTGIPLYPDSDLPSAVKYNGDTLNHDSELQFTGSTYYLKAGAFNWELRTISPDDPVLGTPCLMSDGIEDEFANTYLVEWTGDSCTVNRTSLCCWSGTSDAFGAEVSMCYNGTDASTALYKWLLDITWPTAVPGYPGTPGTGGSIKDDPQNSPDGSYPNLGGWDLKPAESGVTVS